MTPEQLFKVIDLLRATVNKRFLELELDEKENSEFVVLAQIAGIIALEKDIEYLEKRAYKRLDDDK